MGWGKLFSLRRGEERGECRRNDGKEQGGRCRRQKKKGQHHIMKKMSRSIGQGDFEKLKCLVEKERRKSMTTATTSEERSSALWRLDSFGSTCVHHAVQLMVHNQYYYNGTEGGGNDGGNAREGADSINGNVDWWQWLLQVSADGDASSPLHLLKNTRDDEDGCTGLPFPDGSSLLFTLGNRQGKTCFDVFFSSWFRPSYKNCQTIPGIRTFERSMRIVCYDDGRRIANLRTWIQRDLYGSIGNNIKKKDSNDLVDDDEHLRIVSRFWRAFEIMCRHVDRAGRRNRQQDIDAGRGVLSQSGGKGFSLVHFMSQYLGNCCPDYVALLAVLLYPDQPRSRDEDGNLPLHLWSKHGPLLRNKNSSDQKKGILRALLRSYPDALTIPDRDGRLPFHLATVSSAAASSQSPSTSLSMTQLTNSNNAADENSTLIETMWKTRPGIVSSTSGQMDPVSKLYCFALAAVASPSPSTGAAAADAHPNATTGDLSNVQFWRQAMADHKRREESGIKESDAAYNGGSASTVTSASSGGSGSYQSGGGGDRGAASERQRWREHKEISSSPADSKEDMQQLSCIYNVLRSYPLALQLQINQSSCSSA